LSSTRVEAEETDLRVNDDINDDDNPVDGDSVLTLRGNTIHTNALSNRSLRYNRRTAATSVRRNDDTDSSDLNGILSDLDDLTLRSDPRHNTN
jgi:hypothetical protein